jgi:putative acetyltransferase
MELAATIIEYHDRYHEAFRQLNLEWLKRYNLLEDPDMIVLNDPRGTILDHGGFIWLAQAENEIIGSSALMREGAEGTFELAKMAVAPAWRGKGISKLLIQTCLAKATELNAKKVTLFSNHQLKTALKLYEQYGFHYIEMKDSPFVTADIKMELVLDKITR